MSTDKGEKEENWMKSKLMSYSYKHSAENGLDFDEEEAQQAETFQIQTLMKMFALACKSDREFRAFDICELLPNQRSVSLAIKYAAGIRKMNLAERLNELARRKAEEEEEAMENELSNPYEIQQPDWRHRSAPRSVPKKSTRKPRVEQQREEDEEEMEDEYDQNDYEKDDDDDDDEPLDDKKSRHSSTSDNRKPNPLLQKSSKPFKTTTSPSLSSSQGRSNPFKVLSPSKNSKGGKSFLESVEEEQKAAAEAVKNKQTSITKKANMKKTTKTPKQMTLLSPHPQSEEPNEKDTKKTDGKPSKKKSGFNLWLEENSSVIAEENKEASEGDLIKISMKQWKNLPNDEKKAWNEKAAGKCEDTDDKKRKRKNTENDENENEYMNTTATAKSVKKMKPANEVSVSSKLASFAYTKS